MFDAGRQEDEVVLANNVVLPGDLHQPLAFEHVIDLLLHVMLVARDMTDQVLQSRAKLVQMAASRLSAEFGARDLAKSS